MNTTKHDGNLDIYSDKHSYSARHAEAAFIEYPDDWWKIFGSQPVLIQIEGGYSEDWEDQTVRLDAKQALSLLEWLKQQEKYLLQQLP